MTENAPASMYQKYHVDKSDERLGLFRLLAERFNIESALYPGCFVHVTPSFVIPKTTYVETDRRARNFFNDPALTDFVAKYKTYTQDTKITYHSANYNKDFGEQDQGFDLLISQYAGIVTAMQVWHLSTTTMN